MTLDRAAAGRNEDVDGQAALTEGHRDQPRQARAGYDAIKRSLFAGLRGTVLEIGAGKGANFSLLPADVRWLGLEPSRRYRRRLARSNRPAVLAGAVLAGVAEHIPLRDNSVDAVISTIVLCSVQDQDQVLAEVRRVLRPGGTFVFCEHVAAPRQTWARRCQRAVAPLSRRFDLGCDPSRETWHAIERAGFAHVELEWFTIPPRWSVYNPCIAGRAVA
jgi:ubiquinone/menaquinone biosynthesis C-methylase UbiE